MKTNISNILALVKRWMVKQEVDKLQLWLPPPPLTDHLNITELPHKKITESFTLGLGRSLLTLSVMTLP